MKIFKRVLFSLFILIGLSVMGFVIWGSIVAEPMPQTIEAMRSSDMVQVSAGKWLVFEPKVNDTKTGYIFYPGGRVDYRAYTPYARALADQGYLVVIPRMPLNLAVFGINSANSVIKAYPDITHWVIGGHSLGGSMAADYLFKHPTQIDGLVLLASYPATSDNLSGYKGSVVSISGSLDGLATPAKIAASRPLLPPGTIWVEISGGDHAQFGWYGPQPGDNPATITRVEQQAIVVQATIELLKQVGNSK